MSGRKEIIEAMQIAEKYDPDGDICCEHDVLYLLSSVFEVSEEDRTKLEELGFTEYENGWECFV